MINRRTGRPELVGRFVTLLTTFTLALATAQMPNRPDDPAPKPAAVPPGSELPPTDPVPTPATEPPPTEPEVAPAHEEIPPPEPAPPTDPEPPGAEIPTVSLVALETSAAEAGARPARALITRTGSSTAALTVNYAMGGTARHGKDYERLSGQVTLPAGAPSATIEIRPLDDAEVEGLETVKLELVLAPAPFSLAILPDTQYYVSSKRGGRPEMFTSQTRWIVEHKDEFNIVYVLHEGDVTETGAVAEWRLAQASMNLLDGEVPYAIAVGNHDGFTWRGHTGNFNTFFPLAKFAALPTFGDVFAPNLMDNCYHLFSAGGVDWLLLTLEFGPRDAVLDWANRLVARFPDRKAIVLTHAHVSDDDTLLGTAPNTPVAPKRYGAENDGAEVWDKFLRRHPNLALVFNGHVGGDGQGRLVGVGDHGNKVFQMLCNYQWYPGGGSGFLRLIQFFPADDRLVAWSYSPAVDAHLTDPQNHFAYTDLGLFPKAPPPYTLDPQHQEVTLTLVSDDLDPEPVSLVEASAFSFAAEITVRFDRLLDRASATELSHYALDDGHPLRSARLLSDQQTVVLALASPLNPQASSTLAIQGVVGQSASPNLEPPQLATRIQPSPAYLTTDFSTPRLGQWRVVDEGTQEGPSSWFVTDGALWQLSNIHGPDASAPTGRKGSFVYWSSPAAQHLSSYAFTARIRSFDDDGIGVLFRYTDPDNYYKVEFDRQHNFRKLLRLQHGQETTLAAETGSYEIGYELNLQIECVGTSHRVSLNGRPLFGGIVTDTALSRGTVGLYTWSNAASEFSSIAVRPPATLASPTLTLSTPLAGRLLTSQSPILLTADVSADLGVGVSKVEFYQNGLPVGRAFEPPYALHWISSQAGLHSLSARVTDGKGQQAQSQELRLQVDETGQVRLMMPPPRLRLARSAAGLPRLEFPGWPESDLGLEASTNLVDWERLLVAPSLDAPLDSVDPTGYLLPHRFYRVVRVP
ncbi:MAG: hypothetical protein FJ387_03085 [Verrucomicrobia bacterium]|nr:hypothetical protein [Verrucomicrobiota bacterium]